MRIMCAPYAYQMNYNERKNIKIRNYSEKTGAIVTAGTYSVNVLWLHIILHFSGKRYLLK